MHPFLRPVPRRWMHSDQHGDSRERIIFTMTENIMLDIVTDLEKRTTELAPTVADVVKLEADLKSNRYSAQAIKEEITPKLNAARDKIRAAKDEANKAVAAMVNTYITDLQRLDALNPAELTDDFKLLNGGVTLNAQDIEFMLERNAKNRSMAQLILRYAKEHDIDVQGVSYIDHADANYGLKSPPSRNFKATVTEK